MPTSSGAVSNWGCGSVKWGKIFKYQTHGGWMVLIAAAVITAIAHFSIKPQVRPMRLYDASISLPSNPDTVSIYEAAYIPFAALVATVLAVEFGALYKRQSLTRAIHALFHVIWWAIIGFAVVLAITEATKPFASRYRPDYLSRCKVPSTKGTALQEGQAVEMRFKQNIECDRTMLNDADVKDGRKSFPSGHSSNSMSLCWFTILYLVHALYWRDGWRFMGSVTRGGCGRRFLSEVLQGLFIVWGLGVISIAWVIGVTRFRDNRHNIDDILGGFVAALLWMTPCTLIALGQLNFFHQQLRREEEEEEGVLPTSAHVHSKQAGLHTAPGVVEADHTSLAVVPPGSHNSGKAVHGAAGQGLLVPGAAAADDGRATPAHLLTLGSEAGVQPPVQPPVQHHVQLPADTHSDPAGVVPVADANGLPSSRKTWPDA